MFTLASKSPRRVELLKEFFPDIKVIPSEIDESAISSKKPANLVMRLSQAKGRDVIKRYGEKNVIAADTVVVLENEILGKPKNKDNAKSMLGKLSGKTHTVITGVSVFVNNLCFSFYEETEVEFYPLSEKEINWYVNTGEPLDKAGGYGIQGLGKIFIKSIKGDYFNVMGFPISKFFYYLKKYKVEIPFLK